MRALELFGGIGGFAEAAVPLGAEIVATVDHDRPAQAVYAANFPRHRREVKNLASVKPAWLAGFEAELWWMSPPCAPHGVRGAQRDLDDPRSAALLNVLAALPVARPRAVAVENVPWFEGSRAHAALRAALDAAGLVHRREGVRCPTELGLPVRRRRFYLLASRDPLRDVPPHRVARPLAACLGEDRPELAPPAEVLARFGGALHRVDPDDPGAVAACFTRAYGTSPVAAGSYLARRGVLRLFAPEEIARLHGHRAGIDLAGLPLRDAWRRVGNGLSVDVVSAWLRAVPALSG